MVNPDDPSVNAHSQQITVAEGSNTYGIVNQHPSFTADAASVKPHEGGMPQMSENGDGTLAGAAKAVSGAIDGLVGSGDKDQTNGSREASQEAGAGSAESNASAAVARFPFRVGVAEDRNKRWRRTMEDSHAFVYDYGGVQGQGFFSIFDGHAGKHSAEWCGQHFHDYFLQSLKENADMPVPDVLNLTFHNVDRALSKLAQEQGSSSGCTAVTAFLRLEDESGVPVAGAKTGGVVSTGEKGDATVGGAAAGVGDGPADGRAASAATAEPGKDADGSAQATDATEKRKSGGLFRGFGSRRSRQSSTAVEGVAAGDDSTKEEEKASKKPELVSNHSGLLTVSGKDVKRVLYTANVGDARAVLCREGKAIRLTYDHKGSDAQEAKRITDAGGFVMNNRVNGVLAVTRSLGDSSMKEFVVGAPYTTETALTEDDTFLIVACDGLWDVVDDQDAVDLVKNIENAQTAAEKLLKHALQNFSTDNTSVMVVRFAVHPDAVSQPKTS